MTSPVIKFLRLRPESDSDIPLPRYMTPQSAGMDICAAISEAQFLEKGEIALLPTGFAMALPQGYEAQIRPGTIDADYRGEVKIAVINLGPEPYTFHRGDRVAQMIIHRIHQVELQEVEVLDETSRNTGGFGHTGT